MNSRALLTAACTLSMLLLLTAGPAPAEISRREAGRLGVDVLTLKIGGELRGVLLVRGEDGSLQIAVRRDWLAAHQPALLRKLPASTPGGEHYRELIERIDRWLDDLGADASRPPYSPKPAAKSSDAVPAAATDERQAELLRVLEAERQTYQEYVDDPLKLPPGEGSTAARREAYQQLVRHLDSWIADLQKGSDGEMAAGDDARAQQNREELIRILKSERETYAGKIDDAAREKSPQPDFVLIELSRADVGQIFAQSDARRQLALAAYQHHLANVEELTVAELQGQLTANGVDLKKDPATVFEVVGVTPPQDEREWAARRAVYEYQFLKRLDFQGTGDFIVQTGEDAPPPNLADVLQGTLDQQMSLALGDLLQEPIFTGLDFGGLAGGAAGDGWMKKATRIAQKQGVRGFRVTRITPDIPRRRTLVEDRFLARMPDGKWETIWMTQATKAAAGANQNDLDRIRQDPQVQQALGLVEGLGLGNQGQLDLALQFGAATMNAQQATDDEFYEFRDRYSRSLSGPPLRWK